MFYSGQSLDYTFEIVKYLEEDCPLLLFKEKANLKYLILVFHYMKFLK